MVDRQFSEMDIADIDTVGRKISRYKKVLLSGSKMIDNQGKPFSVFLANQYGEKRFEHSKLGVRVGTLNAAHDMSVYDKDLRFKYSEFAFEEYYAIIKRPYFILFDPDNMTPATLAKYMYEQGIINKKECDFALTRIGADETRRNSNAASYVIKKLSENGFDAIAFMNERYDPGSIGLIVFDESKLIPVAVNGLPVENSDRTLADSENEPAFFMPENNGEDYVENSDEDFLDAVEDKEYNGDTEQLTNTEKLVIKEKTGWSDEIVDHIHTIEEAQIYIDANLKEFEINGRKCLIRSDIDMDYVDSNGVTNWERMKRGNAPKTVNDEEIHLHHIGQNQDSPLAELTKSEHLGKGNYSILHDTQKTSEIKRTKFKTEKKNYWKNRFIKEDF